MKEDDRIEMMRALADELSAEERAAFERRLATDAALRGEWEALQRTQGALRAAPPAAFKPFFAARVMRRIEGPEKESLADALLWLFRPLAPAALVLAGLLAFSNWSERELVGDDPTLLEAVFVAVPATAEAAYVMDIYYASED